MLVTNFIMRQTLEFFHFFGCANFFYRSLFLSLSSRTTYTLILHLTFLIWHLLGVSVWSLWKKISKIKTSSQIQEGFPNYLDLYLFYLSKNYNCTGVWQFQQWWSILINIFLYTYIFHKPLETEKLHLNIDYNWWHVLMQYFERGYFIIYFRMLPIIQTISETSNISSFNWFEKKSIIFIRHDYFYQIDFKKMCSYF